MLFYVFPVCYDVRLSHPDKYYLLAYLLTYLTPVISLQNLGLRAEARVHEEVNM